ncbi:MAG TPA: hypothetical protein VKB89_22580 [Xanthobacteraceae bacterium]|nr:hypothetical protein [Xanthobacteraceae bacterium]
MAIFTVSMGMWKWIEICSGDHRVETLAGKRPEGHGRRQPLPHSVDGGDDEPVGLRVRQETVPLLHQGLAQNCEMLARVRGSYFTFAPSAAARRRT